MSARTFLFIWLLTSSIHTSNAYNNGVGRLPYMGWNSWCTGGPCMYDVCDDTEIKSIANALLKNGMYDVGYRYINLDDCWLACNRTSNGSLYAEPTRFPDGIANTIKYVHNLDSQLRFGLYTDVGTHTCAAGQRDNCNPPGLYGHYQQDAETLASWKVDLIKLDDCSKPDNETWQNVLTQASAAFNATGRPILLETDGRYQLPPPAYLPSIVQAWRICRDHHDNWNSTKETITYVRQGNNSAMSGPYGWAYNDFLMTGGQGCVGQGLEEYKHCPGQTDSEYKTEFAIFAISAAPLLVATDIRNMTDIMKTVLLNTEIISVNQQDQTKAGNYLYTYECKSNMTDACQIWSRKLNVTNTIAVVLLNIDDEDHQIVVQFDQLDMGWNSDSKVMVRDLWLHKYVGTYIGNYSSQVEQHGNFFGILTLQ